MAAPSNPDALPGLAVLEQTPIIIEKIVWSASEEQMHWKPAMDRWSISEVLAHLGEVEVLGFRERIQKMLEKNNPALEPYDQNAAYAAGKYSSGKAREHLKTFCHERDRSLFGVSLNVRPLRVGDSLHVSEELSFLLQARGFVRS